MRGHQRLLRMGINSVATGFAPVDLFLPGLLMQQKERRGEALLSRPFETPRVLPKDQSCRPWLLMQQGHYEVADI